MRRRTFLAGAGAAVSAAAGLSPATDVTARLPRGLERLLFAGTTQSELPSPDTLAGGVAAARRAYAASRYHALGRGLPNLLGGLHTSRDQATGTQRELLSTLLAHAYVLASALCTKLGDDAIAWVLADRALGAARETDDGAVVAAATHAVAIAMRREGHHQGALHLLTTTAENLAADNPKPGPTLVGAYGNLLCTAAYSSAQAGNATDAAAFINEAGTAADRLGESMVRGTVVPFGRSTVAIYRIGIYTTLGDTATALQSADTVRPADLPGAERYGRFCVDTARAWSRHGKPDRAVQALLYAERHAPEEVNRPSVRDLVSSLLYAPTATPAGLRDLATRIGALT